jgi:nucleotide-binding universal stress UspA family protein
MKSIERILYPTDFSEYSLAALPYAVQIARKFHARLTCLHVIDEAHEEFLRGLYIAPLLAAPYAAEGSIRKAKEIELGEFATAHLSDVEDLQTDLVVGRPFVEIIRYAREHQMDLVVMGTHGHSALTTVLLGSVAEKVVRKSSCPVLTVRHQKHRFEMP